MKSNKQRKIWYEPGVYYYEINDNGFQKIDFLFVFLVILLGFTIVFIGFFALILLTIDHFLFGNIISWYIELLFGFFIFGTIVFSSAGFSLNPIKWYIHFRNIEVEHRDLETEEIKEMANWIDENMKHLCVRKSFTHRTFKFARKIDAMAFKLKWG